MGVFDRMGRVVSSNFNALLDRLEDPGKSVASILDQMGEELRGARREVVGAVAAERQLGRRAEELDREIVRWEQRAALALEKGDESLARAALVHKRRITADRERAEALRGEQGAAAMQMKDELVRMEQRLEELSAKKATLVTQARTARAGGGPEALGRPATGTSPFDELRRMEDQIGGVEASVEAQREIDRLLGASADASRADLEDRFRALEGGAGTAKAAEDVEEELQALKLKYRVQG